MKIFFIQSWQLTHMMSHFSEDRLSDFGVLFAHMSHFKFKKKMIIVTLQSVIYRFFRSHRWNLFRNRVRNDVVWMMILVRAYKMSRAYNLSRNFSSRFPLRLRSSSQNSPERSITSFVYVPVLWIFSRKARSVTVPKNGMYFCSAWYISAHVGICHYKLAS